MRVFLLNGLTKEDAQIRETIFRRRHAGTQSKVEFHEEFISGVEIARTISPKAIFTIFQKSLRHENYFFENYFFGKKWKGRAVRNLAGNQISPSCFAISSELAISTCLKIPKSQSFFSKTRKIFNVFFFDMV